MKKKCFILILTSIVILSCSRNSDSENIQSAQFDNSEVIESNFQSATTESKLTFLDYNELDKKEKMHLFINTMDDVTFYFKNYQHYISEHGLYKDIQFETIKSNLLQESGFIEKINSSIYPDYTTFFDDFKEITETISYVTFNIFLENEDINSVKSEMNILKKNLEYMVESIESESEKEEYLSEIDKITVLINRIESYEEMSVNIDIEWKELVELYYNDLVTIYSEFLPGLAMD